MRSRHTTFSNMSDNEAAAEELERRLKAAGHDAEAKETVTTDEATGREVITHVVSHDAPDDVLDPIVAAIERNDKGKQTANRQAANRQTDDDRT